MAPRKVLCCDNDRLTNHPDVVTCWGQTILSVLVEADSIWYKVLRGKLGSEKEELNRRMKNAA
jgi:hypothetical protein